MKTILVVDDEFDMASTLRAILEREGYRVETCADGREAIERVRASRPDLILMDVMMPVLDGRETVRRLRARPGANQHTPVIGVTGGDREEEVRAALAAGMDACIAKPISAAALYTAIHGCTGVVETVEPERLIA